MKSSLTSPVHIRESSFSKGMKAQLSLSIFFELLTLSTFLMMTGNTRGSGLDDFGVHCVGEGGTVEADGCVDLRHVKHEQVCRRVTTFHWFEQRFEFPDR